MIRINKVMSREFPKDWERQLREISPKTDACSWLMPKWEHVMGKVKGVWRKVVSK